MAYFSQEDTDGFFSVVDSLKKYRRAELRDEKGNDILEDLYTDLLPNEQVLKTCLQNNTTFLVGRKGTGKSTIFQKLQREYRKHSKYLSCYIDAKTVFETSRTEYISFGYLDNTLPRPLAEKYLIERTFIQSILSSIIQELNERYESSFDKIKKVLKINKSDEVKAKLEVLRKRVENNDILKDIELPLLRSIVKKEKSFNEGVTGKEIEVDGRISINPEARSKGTLENKQTHSAELENQFSDIFLRVFQVKELISEIKEILSILGAHHLVIILDDFSEIEDTSLKTFVDVILAPLNNWSDEFIKFKVAAYPTRLYFGKIDKGKVDQIDLDFYNLYSELDRNTMEKRATDFTKRLIEKRVLYFTNKPVDLFFDTKTDSLDDYYELIFQISSNVPRIIGYILFYCYQNSIISDKPINRRALETASQQYYERVIEPFMSNTTYSIMSLQEKLSVLQLNQLLDEFVEELEIIRRKIATNEMSESIYDANRRFPYCSHFHFNPNYEDFIKTLELNFFITKYNELSGRDGGVQSIYALNFGLCMKHNFKWGKPPGSEYRKYFILRPFDFNKVIINFLKKTRKIVCNNCGRNFSTEELKHLEFSKMHCPDCQGIVMILPISEELEKKLESLDQSKMLPSLQRSILYELYKAANPLRAMEIGEELDRSHQLIGKIVKKMDEEMGLVRRFEKNNNRVYELTADGELYFE